MKTISILLAVLFLNFSGYAQMSKQEKKKWKEKAKEYAKKPQILKQLVEDKEICDSELDSLSSLFSRINNQIDERNDQIITLDGHITMLRQELATARAEVAQYKSGKGVELNKSSAAFSGSSDFEQGIVFRVQIGAFTKPDLSKYFDNNPNFFGQAVPSGEQKATIGVFREYVEANQFKKYMRAMGVRDAWIVPFKDGARVELNEVLDTVQGREYGT